MNHYMAFVSDEPTFGWGSVVGWTGVDLFFVLSGYLIANQLFSGLARGETLSPGQFYARRALRTLPAYWVVLALYFLFPVFMGGRTPPPLWRFLTFTQNLGLEPGTAFSHAWSLCIEEQFYLILPLVLFAGARTASNRSQGWTLIFALLLVGVVSRTILWFDYGLHPHGFYSHIYYSTLCRFDEFLPGIAVAMLKNFHQPLWKRITQYGQRWLLIGAVATVGGLVIVGIVYIAARAMHRPVVTGVQGMIGDNAEVTQSFTGVGRVRYRGELWTARSNTELRAGQTARIVKVEGLTLWVEPS